MRIVKKTSPFGYSNNQQFYHERFDSYKEFYDVLMKRQDKLSGNKRIENVFQNHSADWVGVKSLEEGKNLLLNGWNENVEKLKTEFNRKLKLFGQEKKIKLFNNVAGFMPIVPNALLGLPNSMIDSRLSTKKSKILNFKISIDRGCGNDVNTIIERMSKTLAYIAMLERSGEYRCRIEVFFTAYGDSASDRPLASVGIVIKNENQLFDIKRTCFPVIHPAMLRLFSFSWFESLEKADEMRCWGYGKAFEYWDDEHKKQYINMITDGNEKVICLDLLSDIEKIMKKEVY